MDEFWVAFSRALGTIGPVGIAALAAWTLWLRYGRGPVVAAQVTMHEDNRARMDENRDMLRDLAAASLREEEQHQRMLDICHGVAEQQRRTADILDRIERRMSMNGNGHG